jgi:hypothetical protein
VKVSPVSVIGLLLSIDLAGVVLLSLALVVGSAGLKVKLVFLLVVNNVALVLLALALVMGLAGSVTSTVLLSLALVVRGTGL